MSAHFGAVHFTFHSPCSAYSRQNYSLVFMGSEKYPYKGIIDHLANRGFSNGTNAWTDTDHTAYTASTAGEQGFLQLLPIYVDHILYPTSTQSAFVTEARITPSHLSCLLTYTHELGAPYRSQGRRFWSRIQRNAGA